jgi:hypothetical protein
LNRGDLGDGEDPNPAFAIEVNDAGSCDWFGRGRFRDFDRVDSGSGWVMVEVTGMVADSGKLALRTGAGPETPPCSEAMKYDDGLYPLLDENNGESIGRSAL